MYLSQQPGSDTVPQLQMVSPLGELGEGHKGMYCFCNFLCICNYFKIISKYLKKLINVRTQQRLCPLSEWKPRFLQPLCPSSPPSGAPIFQLPQMTHFLAAVSSLGANTFRTHCRVYFSLHLIWQQSLGAYVPGPASSSPTHTASGLSYRPPPLQH